MKFLIKGFLFFLFCTVSYAQETVDKIELGIPKTTVFLPSDYNGEAQNFDFIQDDKGVLYVANTVGFLGFNGTSWRSFKPIYSAKDCINCGQCWISCPDDAICWTPDKRTGRGDKTPVISFIWDACKGCGVCAVVCPKDAITMERESEGD